MYFSQYPIEVDKIDLYIAKEESNGAATTMKVASNISKPAIGILVIIAMPAAITLEKVIQSLDYLNYMNVEDLPRNIRSVLDFASEGSLFGNLDPFGDFYKFDDGD